MFYVLHTNTAATFNLFMTKKKKKKEKRGKTKAEGANMKFSLK